MDKSSGGFGTLGVTVSPETQADILNSLERSFARLQQPDSAQLEESPLFLLLHSTVLLMMALYRHKVPSLVEGKADPFTPSALISVIGVTANIANLNQLLADLPEPNSEDHAQILRSIEAFPKLLTRALAGGQKSFQHTSGPDRKLSDPLKIRELTDEVYDKMKKGEKLLDIQRSIAKRKDVHVSLKTFQRRFREEKKRRASD